MSAESAPELPSPGAVFDGAPRQSDEGAGRLRVLFYLFFPSSGIARYTHEQMTQLGRFADLELELACQAGYDWADVAPYRVWCGLRSIAHQNALRRRVRFLVAQGVNPLRACRRALDIGADIMHFANINHLTYPLWHRALDRSAVRVAITVHDVRRQKAMLHRGFEDAQLRRLYRRADALFVHAQSQRDELVEFAGVQPERIHLVPHGTLDYGTTSSDRRALRRQFGLPENGQVALFFGNIRDEKNLDLLLRALPRFANRLHVLVAGREGAKGQKPLEFYRALAAELGVEENVTFMSGYIPDEQVPKLFAASDWVALPYSRRFTSQSGVLNVAAQYHRPVVISSAPTFEETLRACDVGVLVEPDDLAALESGIEEMCRRIDENHQHEFDRYARLFGWEENARRTREVYYQLVGQTAP